MEKVNKYFELMEQHSKDSLRKLHALSEDTLRAMEDAVQMYNEQVARIKVNELYEKALQQAKELKAKEINSLIQLLDAEKAKLHEPCTLNVNEQILLELQKLNNFNSFKATIKSMPTSNILKMSQEQYLSDDQVNIIKAELTERSKACTNADEITNLNNLVLSIAYTSDDDLLEQAYQRINSYNLSDNMFPGLCIGEALGGGVSKLLGIELVNKVNSINFFR